MGTLKDRSVTEKIFETSLIFLVIVLGLLNENNRLPLLTERGGLLVFHAASFLLGFYFMYRNTGTYSSAVFMLFLILSEGGAMMKTVQVPTGTLMISVSLFFQVLLLLYFTSRPLRKKIPYDISFYLILMVTAVFIIQPLLLIFRIWPLREVMYLNFFSMGLIGILNFIKRKETHETRYEDDILNFFFIQLFISSVGYFL